MKCLGCGYSLDEIKSSQCPECGRQFDRSARSTFAGDIEERASRKLGCINAMGGTLCIGFGLMCLWVAWLTWKYRSSIGGWTPQHRMAAWFEAAVGFATCIAGIMIVGRGMMRFIRRDAR